MGGIAAAARGFIERAKDAGKADRGIAHGQGARIERSWDDVQRRRNRGNMDIFEPVGGIVRTSRGASLELGR